MKNKILLMLISFFSFYTMSQVPNTNWGYIANNLSISFSDSTLNSPTFWLWDFGDGNTSTQQNPTHTYVASGTYSICLTTSNGSGADSSCRTITVSCPLPDLKWGFNKNDLSVSFSDSTLNSPTSWLWDFGDGNTSTQQNPIHTYASTGSYTVCLTTTNDCGTDSSCKLVTVSCPLPDLNWGFNTNNLSVSFSDSTLNSPTSWLWDFGDGNTSTQQNPIHTYASTGSYTVCLITTNDCGTDSSCKLVTVSCPLPDLNWGFNKNNLSVSFSDSTLNSPTSWFWDFGDGNTSTQQNPIHTYASNGNYTVCLTTTNSCGADSSCKLVTVSCPLPDVNWSFDANGLIVSFSDSTLNTPFSWLWDFGDGNTSTQQNPIYSYSAVGNYTVCLTTSNSCGADSTCKFVSLFSSGTELLENHQNLHIYPNPANNYLEISCNENIQKIYLLDARGSLVQSFEHFNSSKLDISKLEKGVYFLKVEASSISMIKRFLKK